jgi:flagellar hook protein FlgE
MDVIGNNIANVNTAGYKYSRTVFQDLYSQSMGAASASTASRGGTNPNQIGLGVTLNSIDIIHTQGAAQYTGTWLDNMIDGDGYFVKRIYESDGTTPYETVYTRAGNFYLDNNDYLVDADGMFIMGYTSPVPDTPTQADLAKILIDDATYYNVKIDDKGMVSGINRGTGLVEDISQLAIATFANISGLEKAGGNNYVNTPNSGNAVYGKAGGAGVGVINPNALEMSNVDLATEFTDMIVTQRGFQANSRTITVSDTMLEELINLKR